jgi:hypothetical protein
MNHTIEHQKQKYFIGLELRTNSLRKTFLLKFRARSMVIFSLFIQTMRAIIPNLILGFWAAKYLA